MVTPSETLLFALELAQAGIPGGIELKALVFLVIAMTVTLQGLSGGLVARILGVRRAENSGYLVLGASPLARHLARHLAVSGDEVILIDSNADERRAAEAEGFQVLGGNALDSATLARVRPDTRVACIGLTANEDINLEFARKIGEEFRGPETYVAIEADASGVTADAVLAQHARVLFGGARGLQVWFARWRADGVETAWYARASDAAEDVPLDTLTRSDVLPLMLRRGGKLALVDSSLRIHSGDQVEFAVDGELRAQAHEWLASAGWSRLDAR